MHIHVCALVAKFGMHAFVTLQYVIHLSQTFAEGIPGCVRAEVAMTDGFSPVFAYIQHTCKTLMQTLLYVLSDSLITIHLQHGFSCTEEDT